MREAWIIDHARSPRGRGKPGVGSLSHIHPQRCLAQVLNGLQERVGFDPADIEDVVAGCGAISLLLRSACFWPLFVANWQRSHRQRSSNSSPAEDSWQD